MNDPGVSSTTLLWPAPQLASPSRLAALRRIAALDTPSEPAFDRLTRLAARALHVPVALVSLVDSDRQFFKSCVGLREPWASARQTPLSHSFCQYVVAAAAPLVVEDARLHPQLRENLALPDLGVVAYAGIPLITADEQVVGSFCAIDTQPRVWVEEELDTLRDLAAAVMAQLELPVIAREAVQEADALRAGEARYRALVQNAADVIVVLDLAGVLHYVSPAITRIVGCQPEDWLGRAFWTLVHPDDLPHLQVGLARVRDQAGILPPVAFRVRHADGSWRWLEAVATNLLDDPDVAGVVQSIRDITERKRLEVQITHQARHDALTALPNRTLFLDRLTQALAATERQAQQAVVLFIDLDGFKVVNDSLGHASGDALLVKVSERLAGALRPGDTLARFGGDEFTALIQGVDGPALAHRIAERLVRVLDLPFTLGEREVFLSASAGVALPSTAPTSPSELLRHAEIALYRAKAAGNGRAVVFDRTMEDTAVERLALETDLRQAVERGELRLHYQPILELATERIAGVEALVRWQHPTRGLVYPAAFIPLAEETGLILPIGAWVLAEACHQAQLWQALRPLGPQLVMSVNVAAAQLGRQDFAATVAALLQRSGLPPAALELEITESVLMQAPAAGSTTLPALRALGVRIALDDFGTGYSSLSYLGHFAVDTLKVDQSFVQELGRNETAGAIVQTIVALARGLQIEVTAEGVETAAQLAAVRAYGCATAQGYYFAKPLPPEELAARLVAEPSAVAALTARTTDGSRRRKRAS